MKRILSLVCFWNTVASSVCSWTLSRATDSLSCWWRDTKREREREDKSRAKHPQTKPEQTRLNEELIQLERLLTTTTTKLRVIWLLWSPTQRHWWKDTWCVCVCTGGRSSSLTFWVLWVFTAHTDLLNSSHTQNDPRLEWRWLWIMISHVNVYSVEALSTLLQFMTQVNGHYQQTPGKHDARRPKNKNQTCSIVTSFPGS